MTDTPRTAAGRALVEDEPRVVTGEHSMLRRVLAIEAEAAAPDPDWKPTDLGTSEFYGYGTPAVAPDPVASPADDDFRDAHERAMRDHILDKTKGWPHKRIRGDIEGCDDLCSDDIVDRLPVASPAPLDRELVRKALSVCGVYDPTYIEMFAAEYDRLARLVAR